MQPLLSVKSLSDFDPAIVLKIVFSRDLREGISIFTIIEVAVHSVKSAKPAPDPSMIRSLNWIISARCSLAYDVERTGIGSLFTVSQSI